MTHIEQVYGREVDVGVREFLACGTDGGKLAIQSVYRAYGLTTALKVAATVGGFYTGKQITTDQFLSWVNEADEDSKSLAA